MVIVRLRRVETGTAPPVRDPLDSLLEVLNRDQRTTITIDRKVRSEGRNPRRADFGVRPAERPKAPHRAPEPSSFGFSHGVRSRSRGPRRRLARLAWRLGEVFIVGVCLLTVVRVPAVMSAPSTRRNDQTHSHKPTENTLSYLHPCGKSHEEEMNNTYYKASKETNPEVLRHIIIRTKNALAYAESFRERYVEKTFHTSFENHHAQWASQRYEWLPNQDERIPKRLGEPVTRPHLKSKTFDEFLVDIYESLQAFAVALEQVVVDQKRMQGEFRENFRMLEVHLRNVLCEVREAMIERNTRPRTPVPRSIMKDEVRHLESPSYRNVRDWVIFRSLMNGLEYVIQVFTFIEENLPETSAGVSSS